MTRIVELEHLAGDWVAAHDGDAAALARLNTHYERDFTASDVRAEIWRRVYAYRQRSSRVARNVLEPDEARLLIAQDVGHGSWDALLAAGGAAPTGAATTSTTLSPALHPADDSRARNGTTCSR